MELFDILDDLHQIVSVVSALFAGNSTGHKYDLSSQFVITTNKEDCYLECVGVKSTKHDIINEGKYWISIWVFSKFLPKECMSESQRDQ